MGRGGQRTTTKRKHAPCQTRGVEEEAGSGDDLGDLDDDEEEDDDEDDDYVAAMLVTI